MMNQELVKLDRFDGCTYTRSADKMKFLLILLKVYYVLDSTLAHIPSNPIPKPGQPIDEKRVVELEKMRMIHKENEIICCGHIKNALFDTLYDLYASVTNPRELWSALEFNNPIPKPGQPVDEKRVVELEKMRMIHKENEIICCGHIKNALSDTLYDLYASVTNPRELWSALEFKYKPHEKSIN
nr:copia-like retrotransposon [Tanacetum cinerariifolium]